MRSLWERTNEDKVIGLACRNQQASSLVLLDVHFMYFHLIVCDLVVLMRIHNGMTFELWDLKYLLYCIGENGECNLSLVL